MKEALRLVSLPFVVMMVVAFGAMVFAEPPPAADAAAPAKCVSKQSTAMIKKACERGGQPAAKKAMKGWVKKVKAAKKAAADTAFKLNCKTCHVKVKGDFPLKDDGAATFKRLDEWLKSQSAATPHETHSVAALLSR